MGESGDKERQTVREKERWRENWTEREKRERWREKMREREGKEKERRQEKIGKKEKGGEKE